MYGRICVDWWNRYVVCLARLGTDLVDPSVTLQGLLHVAPNHGVSRVKDESM
jgi:hypothetical protein